MRPVENSHGLLGGLAIEELMKNLAANNMKPYYVETKAEVVPLVESLLNAGDSVAVGGSVSLFQSGVIEHLRSGRYNFIDRYAEGLTREELHEVFIKSMSVDAYLCSSNAITEAGELYNVDGNANRIAAISFGPKSVIMVVGKNKITADLNEAIARVKEVATPMNCERLSCDTYCLKTGRCISIAQGKTGMTAGCDSPARICCSYLISGMQRKKDRIKVILVGEDLGF